MNIDGKVDGMSRSRFVKQYTGKSNDGWSNLYSTKHKDVKGNDKRLIQIRKEYFRSLK